MNRKLDRFDPPPSGQKIVKRLTNCGNCGHNLTKLELIKDGSLKLQEKQSCPIVKDCSDVQIVKRTTVYLSGGIETDHENTHLLLAEHALPDTRE